MVLAVSVVGGVAVGVTASAMTSDEPTVTPRTGGKPDPVALPRNDVEVKDPVLVMNDDGGATLSATVVNHMPKAVGIDRATGGQDAKDHDAPVMLVHGTRSNAEIQSGESVRIGGVGDEFRLRFTDRVQVGSTLPVTLFLGHGNVMENGPTVTFLAPVVERTTEHVGIANNGPNHDITVRDAKIVVVPGQEKAYVTGSITSTIDDMTELRPTAVGRHDRAVEYRHQTATGGPSGVFASAGEEIRLNIAPYLDREPHGDADYVLASEVSIGETIRVTMRFPSGDLVTKFTVVQGNADGTV